MIISRDSFLYRLDPDASKKYCELSDKEIIAFLKGSIVDLWKCGCFISGSEFNRIRKAILDYNH